MLEHKTLRKKIGDAHRVLCAANCTEAFEVLEHERVDLAVIDVHMPFMNGVELLFAMRERRPDLRAVLVSGLWTARMMRAGFLAGALDCLEKTDEGLVALAPLLERLETVERREFDLGPFELPTPEQIMDEFYLGLTQIYGGNVTRAAKDAGVHRTSMQRSVKRARERTDERKARRGDGE